jgi:hypothetical protein
MLGGYELAAFTQSLTHFWRADDHLRSRLLGVQRAQQSAHLASNRATIFPRSLTTPAWKLQKSPRFGFFALH